MKGLLLAVVLIILIGIAGFAYRSAVEHPAQPIACPLDAEVCPDGTAVSRTGLSCTFPPCPTPNVSLPEVGIAFAVPAGFTAVALPDVASIAAYETAATSPASATSSIIIRRYAIDASSTPLAVIQATAIGGASGAPVPATSYMSALISGRNITIVPIERFEGVVTTAYYLRHGADMLRFDAIDRGVMGWTDPKLDSNTLPAALALKKLLATLQGQ